MQTPVLDARVLRYTQVQGFGTVLLDDGREMPFDVTVCAREPALGATVRVQLGRDRADQLRVQYLEPVAEPEPELALLPVPAALMRLHAAGIAVGLTFERMQAIVDEIYGGDLDDADMVAVLAAHYRASDRAALADGWFASDWQFREAIEDICAELSARIGAPALLSLLGWHEQEPDEDGIGDALGTLHARRRDGGEVTRHVHSLLDVIALFNETLAAISDPRRFHSVETTGDGYAFLLLEPGTHDELRRWRVLPFDRV